MPRRLKEISAKVQEARDDLYLENHRNPTVDEIAAKTGLTEEQIIQALESSQAYGTYSLDKTFEDAGEEGESSFLERYTGFDDKGFEGVEMDEIINKVMSELSEQNRYIFRERFIYNRSQTAIAKTLGVSQMTISRAERNIIQQFRQELARSNGN